MKIRIRNILWSFSAAVLMVLIAPSTVQGLTFAALLAAAAAVLSQFLPDMSTYARQDGSVKTKIIPACVCAAAGLSFYFMWQPSSLVQRIALSIGLTRSGLLAILVVLGAAAAFYSVWTLCFHIKLIEPFEPESVTPPRKNLGGWPDLKSVLFLAIVAIFTITIRSKSSPLYPLNDWVDPNCFFTVGKSMLHGRVLYRDIYEQKGPLLYVLHAVAYLISNTSFLGVYLLEIIAAFAFLLFAYRIARLYCDCDVLFLIPLFSAAIYGTYAFSGDSAEELCLPLLAYALYAGLKSCRYAVPPSNKTFFIIGLTSGCVLWIKYTMLGFYLGWFAVIGWQMLSKKLHKRFWQALAFIAAGVLVFSLPVILYFAVNQALPDLFEAYFYNNIFLYSKSASTIPVVSTLWNAVAALPTVITANQALFFLIFFSFIWFLKQKNKLQLQLFLSCLLFTTFFIYAGGRHFDYYAFILTLFAINAVPLLYRLTKYTFKISFCSRNIQLVFCAAGLALTLLLNHNAYLLSYEKEDLPQYRFKEIIETVENPTLLNYGFLDGGFYTVCDIVPNCKYFCSLNLPLDAIKETQHDYAEQGLTDFIVTRDQEIAYEKYECIAVEEFPLKEPNRTDRLYALKTLNLQ